MNHHSDLKQKREIDSVLMAVLRTELANRRTLLAYIKTAIGLGGVGAGLMKFADSASIFDEVGIAMIPLAGIVLLAGVIDYFKTRQTIEQEKRDAEV